jgi:Tetracyclin repressor-like, C-terminal domain
MEAEVKPALGRVIKSRNPAVAAALIATQLVGVASLRYVLRLPVVVQLEEEDLIVNLGRTIQRYIEGDGVPNRNQNSK